MVTVVMVTEMSLDDWDEKSKKNDQVSERFGHPNVCSKCCHYKSRYTM